MAPTQKTEAGRSPPKVVVGTTENGFGPGLHPADLYGNHHGGHADSTDNVAVASPPKMVAGTTETHPGMHPAFLDESHHGRHTADQDQLPPTAIHRSKGHAELENHAQAYIVYLDPATGEPMNPTDPKYGTTTGVPVIIPWGHGPPVNPNDINKPPNNGISEEDAHSIVRRDGISLGIPSISYDELKDYTNVNAIMIPPMPGPVLPENNDEPGSRSIYGPRRHIPGNTEHANINDDYPPVIRHGPARLIPENNDEPGSHPIYGPGRHVPNNNEEHPNINDAYPPVIHHGPARLIPEMNNEPGVHPIFGPDRETPENHNDEIPAPLITLDARTYPPLDTRDLDSLLSSMGLNRNRNTTNTKPHKIPHPPEHDYSIPRCPSNAGEQWRVLKQGQICEYPFATMLATVLSGLTIVAAVFVYRWIRRRKQAATEAEAAQPKHRCPWSEPEAPPVKKGWRLPWGPK